MIKSMPQILLALALSGSGVAMAQSRPDTLRMTCLTAATLVRQSGAIVMQSGPDIYDRYVAAQNFCANDEIMQPRWLPTADARQCFIGYVCQRESWGAGPR